MLMKGVPLIHPNSSHDLGKVIFTLLVFVIFDYSFFLLGF